MVSSKISSLILSILMKTRNIQLNGILDENKVKQIIEEKLGI